MRAGHGGERACSRYSLGILPLSGNGIWVCLFLRALILYSLECIVLDRNQKEATHVETNLCIQLVLGTIPFAAVGIFGSLRT